MMDLAADISMAKMNAANMENNVAIETGKSENRFDNLVTQMGLSATAAAAAQDALEGLVSKLDLAPS